MKDINHTTWLFTALLLIFVGIVTSKFQMIELGVLCYILVELIEINAELKLAREKKDAQNKLRR